MFKRKSEDLFKMTLNNFHMKCLQKGSPSLMDYLYLLRATEKLFWGNEEGHNWDEIKNLIQNTLKGSVRNK